MKFTFELEAEDYDSIHDVIMGFVPEGTVITRAMIDLVMSAVPDHIIGEAIGNGWDTCVRDELHTWLKDNKSKVLATK